MGRCLAKWTPASGFQAVFAEALSSSGLFRHNTLGKYVLINLQKMFEIWFSMFNVQVTTL
jgi:hypothetical protein